jgi:hypothetical protein
MMDINGDIDSSVVIQSFALNIDSQDINVKPLNFIYCQNGVHSLVLSEDRGQCSAQLVGLLCLIYSTVGMYVFQSLSIDKNFCSILASFFYRYFMRPSELDSGRTY